MENKDSIEENKEQELDERKELYQVFEKENWFMKFLKKIGLIEQVDVSDENEMKLYNAKNKYFLKGFIYAFVFCIIVFLTFQIKYLVSPFENLKPTVKKINEANYYIDKYYLYDKDPDKLEDYIMYGMLSGLDDKYATYYSKEEVEKLNEETVGEYYGIGVVVLKSSKDGLLTVTKIYEQSDAMNTTLKVGDKIIKVDDVDVTGYDTDEVVKMVRGKEGTKVKLTILKADNIAMEEIEVERKKIENEMVTGHMIDNDIAYAFVDSFDGKAYEQFVKLQETFVRNEAKGLVIDLRNNPGGSLSQLLQLSNLFLDKKLVTTFKYVDGREVPFVTYDGMWDIPIVILVNEYSASAAEAFAGALQGNDRATIVGTQSYGKGVVQELYPLSDGSAIKFTVADYYTPLGINITDKGITPDVVVEYDKTKEDNQLDEAIKVLRSMIK